VLPDVGHVPQLEAAPVVADAIEAWMQHQHPADFGDVA
jgi:pimeloyl-ACP methyl ester carboxylesterase